MAENYSLMLVAWLFILLLGGCVLINAVVDLGARELRRWFSSRRAAHTTADRASKATHIIR
jgi:hypothetical protein